MTIQSRRIKPLRALVIETNDVLTIVVSSVDKNRLIHSLGRRQCCGVSVASRLTLHLDNEVSNRSNTFSRRCFEWSDLPQLTQARVGEWTQVVYCALVQMFLSF